VVGRSVRLWLMLRTLVDRGPRPDLVHTTSTPRLGNIRKRLRSWATPGQQPAPGRPCEDAGVDTGRSIALFVAAALAEIGGAWLVWQGVREHRGWIWVGAGVIALGLYGFVATLQPDANFGRILAAYGGVFVAGSLLWGMVADGFRPDRWDVAGALVCLAGVALIMYAPRAAA
jgi:small multidrug resistance family-3 protein